MKKTFIVELQRHETWTRTFHVEAESSEDAEELAHSKGAEELEINEECTEGGDWETASVTEKPKES
jgi:hypothetical protein